MVPTNVLPPDNFSSPRDPGLSCQVVPLLHLKKTVNEGAKSAFAPICRQTAAPRADLRSVGRSVLRPTFLSLFSFSVVLRCVAAKAAFSLLGRSVAVARSVDAGTQREGEAEGKRGERGSSQAAYQRNFLGVIDRPLPPLSRRPPSAFPLSPALPLSPSLPLLPSASPDHSRRTQNTPKERTNVSCRSIAREKFRGRFAEEYNLRSDT